MASSIHKSLQVMQTVERDVCADGDFGFERTRSPVMNGLDASSRPFLTRKRVRSKSESPSARTSSKLHQHHMQDRRIFADEPYSITQPYSSITENPGKSSNREEKSTVKAESKTSGASQGTTVSIDKRFHELRNLSQEANELGLQQQKHVIASERLQERLVKSERTYGQLLRESLELQRSIEDRRKQIKIDTQELETARAAVKDTGEKLCKVVASIQKLSEEMIIPK